MRSVSQCRLVDRYQSFRELANCIFRLVELYQNFGIYLQGVKSEKTAILILRAVRTSNRRPSRRLWQDARRTPPSPLPEHSYRSKDTITPLRYFIKTWWGRGGVLNLALDGRGWSVLSSGFFIHRGQSPFTTVQQARPSQCRSGRCREFFASAEIRTPVIRPVAYSLLLVELSDLHQLF
jgi:hypothetical protein